MAWGENLRVASVVALIWKGAELSCIALGAGAGLFLMIRDGGLGPRITKR